MDIFDPAQYRGVRRAVGEAETLPAWCYSAPEFYAREVDRIFTPGWHFVARADELPDRGSYLAVDTVPGSLLLLRDGAGRVGAFANTCRHRGARLLDGRGRCRTIVCPYHAWTYGPDGSLLGAPGMQDRPGFDRADWGLTPVRTETWQGFVFVSFSPTGPGLVEHFGDLAEKLGSYDFDRMVCVRRLDYEVACNWKLRRWETGIAEDNGICEAQQAGLASVLRRPGPFALREPAVHRLNNWVLDQVLDGPGRRRAVPDP